MLNWRLDLSGALARCDGHRLASIDSGPAGALHDLWQDFVTIARAPIR